MSDFDTRPKGTVMYGSFDAFGSAERALRVLRNAGYARAAFDAADGTPEREQTVLVVDAAATGAARAAEIMEEHGARVRFVAQTPVAPPPVLAAPLELRAERKPRIRSRPIENVIIITRLVDNVAFDNRTT